MKEEGSYEFTLSGVPTTEKKSGADNMAIGSMVISVGRMESGSFGWSSAPLFNQLKAGTVAADKNIVNFKAGDVKVSRGTFTKDAVCI
jgi:hypothetical protein